MNRPDPNPEGYTTRNNRLMKVETVRFPHAAGVSAEAGLGDDPYAAYRIGP